MIGTRNLNILQCKVSIGIPVLQGRHESYYIWKILTAQRDVIIEK